MSMHSDTHTHTRTHSHTHTHTDTHTHSLTHTLTHLCRHMPYRHNATHAQYPRTQIHICTRGNAEHGCLFLIHAGTLRGLARTPTHSEKPAGNPITYVGARPAFKTHSLVVSANPLLNGYCVPSLLVKEEAHISMTPCQRPCSDCCPFFLFFLLCILFQMCFLSPKNGRPKSDTNVDCKLS